VLWLDTEAGVAGVIVRDRFELDTCFAAAGTFEIHFAEMIVDVPVLSLVHKSSFVFDRAVLWLDHCVKVVARLREADHVFVR